MAEGLAKRKRIHTGHQASLTHMLNKILIPTGPNLEINASKLLQHKLSLWEKLDTWTLRQLDEEMLNLLPEEDEAGMTGEIEQLQADALKEKIYTAMVQIEKRVSTHHVNISFTYM